MLFTQLNVQNTKTRTKKQHHATQCIETICSAALNTGI